MSDQLQWMWSQISLHFISNRFCKFKFFYIFEKWHLQCLCSQVSSIFIYLVSEISANLCWDPSHSIANCSWDNCQFLFDEIFKKIEKFGNFNLLKFSQMCVVIIGNACDPNFCPLNSYHFQDLVFVHTNGKICNFCNFRTRNLKVLSPNYEKAHLLSIGQIAESLKKLHSEMPAAHMLVRTPACMAEAITKGKKKMKSKTSTLIYLKKWEKKLLF